MADQATVPAVETPVEEKHPDGAPIAKGANGVTFWPTEEKAVAIASKRVKGARRAFKVTGPDGRVRYCTAAHPHYAMEYIIETEFKVVVDEVGKPTRASAPVTSDSILAAINSMPEAERESIRKQIESALKLQVKK